MIYVFVAGLVLGLASGGFAAYEMSQGKIQSLEKSIAVANERSLAILESSKVKVMNAEHEATNFNQQLKVSRDQAKNTINDYNKQLADRLYDNKARCKNTMPKDTDTRIHSEDGTDGAELSAEFTAFLYSENKRADLAALDKNILLTYVKNNCGIKE